MARLPDVLAELIAAHDPAFVIALGLARGSAVIRVEAMAVNAVAFTVADNDGAGADGQPIDANGPAGRSATWDATAVAAAIAGAGLPARVSWHAGTHLCNFALYTVAGLLERTAGRVPCGFLHLPFLPEQVVGLMRRHVEETGAAVGASLDEPSMSLDSQLAAVRAAIGVIAAHAGPRPA
jgi:pyroglutamyl-peptidase